MDECRFIALLIAVELGAPGKPAARMLGCAWQIAAMQPENSGAFK
jgi:hypothetical protein